MRMREKLICGDEHPKNPCNKQNIGGGNIIILDNKGKSGDVVANLNNLVVMKNRFFHYETQIYGAKNEQSGDFMLIK